MLKLKYNNSSVTTDFDIRDYLPLKVLAYFVNLVDNKDAESCNEICQTLLLHISETINLIKFCLSNSNAFSRLIAGFGS